MNQNMDIFENFIFSNYMVCNQKFNDPAFSYEQTKSAIRQVLKQNNFQGFSNENNIKDSMLFSFRNNYTISFIFINKFIDIFLNSAPQTQKEAFLYNAMIVTQKKYKRDSLIDILSDVIANNPEAYNRFTRYDGNNTNVNFRNLVQKNLSLNEIFEIMLDKVLQSIIQEKQAELPNNTKNIETSISHEYKNQISNFRINPVTINLCKNQIIDGTQQIFQHTEYSTNNLYACMDIGNIRKRQEDSTLILTHPKNSDFKMLVVADGCGGHPDGDKASAFIVRHIMEWFEDLPVSYFHSDNTAKLQEQFNIAIQKINTSMLKSLEKHPRSTFVGAIVNEKNTIISNVGDSRAYIYDKSKILKPLKQLTKDQTVANALFESGKIKNKDLIRFHADASRLLSVMGRNDSLNINTLVIDNSSYTTLLLASDGLTSILSDKQLKAIIKTTPIKKLAKDLVTAAKTTDAINLDYDPKSKNPDYKDVIRAGSDNISVVLIDNSSKDKKDDDGR